MLWGEVMNFSINITKENIPLHKHKYYEIVVFTKGIGTFHADGKDIAVSPGKIIIIPPKTEHCSSKSSLEFERIYIGGPLHQISFLTSTMVILDNCANDGLALAKMIYKNRYSSDEYISALINAFAHFLLQNIKMEEDIFLATKNIIENISNNFYDCNIDINALLNKSGYSEDYIRAYFKKITGRTPIEFLTKIRIDHACYLMELYGNSFSLTEIAEKCGYSDYVYFSRRFKQTIGVSPRNYMKSS